MANLSDPLLIDRFEFERRLSDLLPYYGPMQLQVVEDVMGIINQMCLEQVAGVSVHAEQGGVND